MKDLTGKGMKRLLLDIRENPGGPLDQAIKVSNRFLPKGDMIVYTRGRIPNSDQDYRAVDNSDYTNIPIVMLANRKSASASEIVTGALQDHDRALVVGETTWGKALVQSIYRLSEGAGLALTTAHYFTPSGRLIQRPWDETFDEYLSYTMRDQDPNKVHPASDLKYTVRLGRKVYSGGGIEPDHRVDGPIEGFNPGKFGRRLYPTMFATFARRFDRDGDTRFGTATDLKARHAINGDFVVDDALMQEFKSLREGADADHLRRGGIQRGSRVHPRDDSRRSGPSDLRRRHREAAPVGEGSAGAVRARDVRGSGSAPQGAGGEHEGSGRPLGLGL